MVVGYPRGSYVSTEDALVNGHNCTGESLLVRIRSNDKLTCTQTFVHEAGESRRPGRMERRPTVRTGCNRVADISIVVGFPGLFVHTY